MLFGHTHNAEHVQMPSGTYVNSGNWLRGHTYVEIDHGKIELKSWERLMLAITFRDLIYRYRQFLIAVVGAGVVFAMALLLTGMANSFRVEVNNTVDSVGADSWVLPDGSTGPFTSFGALPLDTVDQVADMAGVEQADPLAIVPTTTDLRGRGPPAAPDRPPARWAGHAARGRRAFGRPHRRGRGRRSPRRRTWASASTWRAPS